MVIGHCVHNETTIIICSLLLTHCSISDTMHPYCMYAVFDENQLPEILITLIMMTTKI